MTIATPPVLHDAAEGHSLVRHYARGLRIDPHSHTWAQVLYAVSPKVVDQVMHTAYTIFPDSKAARGEKKPSAEAGDGKPEKDEQMSTEAIAMAYLMRGVHF